MINLLPDETKKQLRSAHSNVTLAKCLVVLTAAAVFLALACAASFMFLQSIRSERETNKKNNESTSVVYEKYKKQLDDISDNATMARTILDQQISFSKIIIEIAAALPSGVILEKLDLNKSTISAPIALKIYAQSSDSASIVQDNFTKSHLFTNYTQTVKPNTTVIGGYPVEISASMNINRGVAL